MGEISEMLLDGTMCQQCGDLILTENEEPPGYPVTCGGCLAEEGSEDVGLPDNAQELKRRQQQETVSNILASALGTVSDESLAVLLDEVAQRVWNGSVSPSDVHCLREAVRRLKESESDPGTRTILRALDCSDMEAWERVSKALEHGSSVRESDAHDVSADMFVVARGQRERLQHRDDD